MIIVYDSLTGLGKKFAESLGYPVQDIKADVNEKCLLVTRNVGLGKIPPPTIEFLERNARFVCGAVVNGNKRFGPFYCRAADKIRKIYGVPTVKKISGSGKQEDIDFVKKYLDGIEK
ncbi:MAG: class Ib ribonucleoside-diphosphate reductase assembly flavoprotein NrdI [Clostridiales bacterium]|nr:class Ib ribonucleoside-diphosphate reductase assembly flavoprotein NrdI [Clostridiales bacterium]